MDALKTFNSNNFISFSFSEQENKSNSKDFEMENYIMPNFDYNPFHDNLTIISQSTLNKFSKDNCFLFDKEEENKEKDCSDNNFEYNHGEIFFNKEIEKKEIEKKEEELLQLHEFECNGKKIEDKEKDELEIKKEEKNTKQKTNEKNMNQLNKNEQIFLIIKKKRNNRKKNTLCGRKRKEEKKKGINGSHTRDSEDNKILKIKSFFWKSLYSFIRDSFIENINFLKLEISINRSLKKEFNEDLFKMKLKDIYSKYKISDKYVHYAEDTNEKLIKKIYKENKETVAKKILNLTYIEAFDIFRRKIMGKDISPELKNKIKGTDFLDTYKFKDFDGLIEKIREEEGENNIGDIEEYINDIKRLCLQFEEWFKQKIGRNRPNNPK